MEKGVWSWGHLFDQCAMLSCKQWFSKPHFRPTVLYVRTPTKAKRYDARLSWLNILNLLDWSKFSLNWRIYIFFTSFESLNLFQSNWEFSNKVYSCLWTLWAILDASGKSLKSVIAQNLAKVNTYFFLTLSHKIA